MHVTERIFLGALLSTDGVVCDHVEIAGYRARRGSHDGLVWRGFFTLPDGIRGPRAGETLHIQLADRSQIPLVVTEVVSKSVCFRARGKMPA